MLSVGSERQLGGSEKAAGWASKTKYAFPIFRLTENEIVSLRSDA